MDILEEFYHVVSKYTRLLENHCKRKGYHEISVAGYQYLMKIYQCGSLTLSQLAKKQGVTLASAAKLAEVLSKRGYIEKRVNAQNHRSRDVFITPKGLALLTDQNTLYTEFSQVLHSALSLDEIATLDIILGKLLKEMAKNDACDPP